MKYMFKINDTQYQIPSKNIVILALSKAMEVGYNKPIKTEEQAIQFFKEKFGLEVVKMFENEV